MLALTGVGPVTAGMMLDAFGVDLPKVLDGPDAVARLKAVKGLKRRAEGIKKSWEKRRGRLGRGVSGVLGTPPSAYLVPTYLPTYLVPTYLRTQCLIASCYTILA